ncbi:MAG: hypothetical protein HY277_00860, partial [Ignavibacteriales bacterium]|nr:hypothetical protein [Ignavibacteriales bacterium]
LRSLGPYVKNETLAVELNETSSTGGYSAEWDINGEACAISIERVKNNGAGR